MVRPFLQLPAVAWLLPVLLCAIFIRPVSAHPLADGLLAEQSYPNPVGRHFSILKSDQSLTPQTLLNRYLAGELPVSQTDVPSFGLSNRQDIWLVTRVDNASTEAIVRQVRVESSWLEQVDLYLLNQSTTLASYPMGDARPFAKRPVKSRYFAANLELPPGRSYLLLRINSLDPAVAPIYFESPAIATDRAVAESYHYGLLYGAVLALLIYNLFLGLKLRNRSGLIYALYLASFIAMNYAYTGHGFASLWPENPIWQQWSNPTFMILFSLSGLCFACSFLELKKNAPALQRLILGYQALIVVATLVALLAASHAALITLAFASVLQFSLAVALLGLYALKKQLPSANYFFAATLLGVSGAGITCVTVWGLIPFYHYAYLAVELGLLGEALLLSLALADRLNQIETERNLAKYQAQIDPLSSLFNRRAFDEIAPQLWQRAQAEAAPMSVTALDIDRFKGINDEHGHVVGDRVIKRVSQIIKSHCRPSDVIVRWGGDEFILLLPNTNKEQALAIAERCRQAIHATRIALDEREIQVSVSVGIAEKSPADGTLEILMRRADDNLYSAKRAGRNLVISD
ncbi:diguanylate cyclase [Halioxenophilus sp. WMMB6]|uniref:sensor domain-containing diguanylate cyclase n=1 Tax=Halioxenophilus sp. WMMB6 TaxID=3073815 RepID=UPI00295F5A47|nr:diguanylate cyclase [Halioxenophilus sp. WMMB6]